MDSLYLKTKSVSYVRGRGNIALISLAENGIMLEQLPAGQSVDIDGGGQWLVSGVECARLNGKVSDQVGVILTKSAPSL